MRLTSCTILALIWGAVAGLSLRAAADLPLAVAEKADKVVVLKGERKLMLLKNDQVLKTYRISLGGNPRGPKVRRGDSKTPEGEYVLDRRNANSLYYRSIHISYPNAADRARAKKLGVAPGGDLFIHGVPSEFRLNRKRTLPPDWTDGCIAVSNEEMDEIWRVVPDGTPILIKP